MKKLFFIFSAVLLSSCIKETDPVITGLERAWLSGNGVFIMNEGNFRSGNGSISFFSYDSMKIYNNIFREANERPLGDVPYSMGFTDNKAYILVNNSDKIEVAGINTMKSVTTIGKVVSPRYISFVSSQKAYVTSLYSDSIRIIDLQSETATGYVPVENTSESIASTSSSAYVANWSGGNKILLLIFSQIRLPIRLKWGRSPKAWLSTGIIHCGFFATGDGKESTMPNLLPLIP